MNDLKVADNVRPIRRCMTWCTATHTPAVPDPDGFDIDEGMPRICTRSIHTPRGVVELTSEDLGPTRLSIIEQPSRYIEDLDPGEAETLAAALLEAAAIARGAR